MGCWSCWRSACCLLTAEACEAVRLKPTAQHSPALLHWGGALQPSLIPQAVDARTVAELDHPVTAVPPLSQHGHALHHPLVTRWSNLPAIPGCRAHIRFRRLFSPTGWDTWNAFSLSCLRAGSASMWRRWGAAGGLCPALLARARSRPRLRGRPSTPSARQACAQHALLHDTALLCQNASRLRRPAPRRATVYSLCAR